MADRKRSALAGQSVHPAWVPGPSGNDRAPERPLEVVPDTATEPSVLPADSPLADESADTNVSNSPKGQVEAPVEPQAKPRRTPAQQEPAPTHSRKPEWTIHARQLRTGLMAWSAARAKVDDRAKDVREHLRVAGRAMKPEEMRRVAESVATQTGHPLEEVLDAAGLPRDA